MNEKQRTEALAALAGKSFLRVSEEDDNYSVGFDRQGAIYILLYDKVEGSEEPPWGVEDDTGEVIGEGETALEALESMEAQS